MKQRAILLSVCVLCIGDRGLCVGLETEIDPANTNALAQAHITAVTYREVPQTGTTTNYLFRVTLDLRSIPDGREINARLVTTTPNAYHPFHFNEVNGRVRDIGCWSVLSNTSGVIVFEFEVSLVDLPSTCLKLFEITPARYRVSPWKRGACFIVDLRLMKEAAARLK